MWNLFPSFNKVLKVELLLFFLLLVWYMDFFIFWLLYNLYEFISDMALEEKIEWKSNYTETRRTKWSLYQNFLAWISAHCSK